MPQESNTGSIFYSPNKNSRGLKGLICNSNNNAVYAEEIINDRELAHRKAEEAGNLKNKIKIIILPLYI